MTFDIARARAHLTPARPALWFAGRWYDYRQLDERASRLASRLAQKGLGKADRVTIVAHNHVAHIDLLLATAKLGVIYTPFNHRLSEREQAELADYVRPSLIIHDQPNAISARAAATAGRCELLDLESYEEWLAGAAPMATAGVEPKAEDIQMILFTGGTTGTPKGAMLPYRQGFYNAVNTVFSWGLRDDDCVIQATPCFHAAINAFTTPLLHLGARVVLQRSFDPLEYLRLVEEQRATILFLVPTMYQMLARHEAFASTDLSSVRWAISGGAPCPEPVRDAFARRGIAFKQGYGLTEAGVNCFAIELDDAADRPLSVGKPMLHAKAVIRDEEGDPVAAGEVGELTLHGSHLFSGYFERPDATAECLREGWLWTGDLARQDPDGFFFLVGRRKEMFISGGENVFPAEVENALYQHPLVAECAVVGVPSERWGEVGLAAVVLIAAEERYQQVDAQRHAGQLLAQELKEFLREGLARYKVPKLFLFLDELPKSGAGKILKRELAQRASEALADSDQESAVHGSLAQDKRSVESEQEVARRREEG